MKIDYIINVWHHKGQWHYNDPEQNKTEELLFNLNIYLVKKQR